MARGGLEDLETGEVVAIETAALTPWELSAALARSLLATPNLARLALREALPRPLRGLRARLRDKLGR